MSYFNIKYISYWHQCRTASKQKRIKPSKQLNRKQEASKKEWQVSTIVSWKEHGGRKKEGGRTWGTLEPANMYRLYLSLPALFLFVPPISYFFSLKYFPSYRKGRYRSWSLDSGNPHPSHSIVLHEGRLGFIQNGLAGHHVLLTLEWYESQNGRGSMVSPR